jgi:glutamyl-tRNA reductase
MSELAARHLIQHGATSILVANRTQSRAEQIAANIAAQSSAARALETDLGPDSDSDSDSDEIDTRCTTEVIPFDDLYAQAARADIVITSTGAQQQLFGQAHARQFMGRRRNRPMFFIDIAVPRDVDPQVNEVEGCFVYDIDDLSQVAQANQADRHREAAAAETIVSREVDRYQERLESLDAVPAILALQQNAETLRQAELARAIKRLGSLTAEQQEAVDVLTRSLTAKLLHPQLTALRKKSEE